MVKYNFIISRVSQSYDPKRGHCERREKKLFPCICEYIKSFLRFLPRAKIRSITFPFFFPFHRLSLPTMRPARHPARGSIWGYFSTFHRASSTPWQAPLSSPIRCFYNESLFTGLSMRYLCYPILRLRASNWNFPSFRFLSLSQPRSQRSGPSTHTWNRFSTSVSATRNDPCTIPIVQPRFSTDKISPLAKFIRAR